MKRIILLLTAIVVALLSVNAQVSQNAQVTAYAIAMQNATDGLYNGSEASRYYAPDIFEDKHPFFEQDAFTNGCIVYAGRSYENVQLKYDIVLDEIVIQQPNFRSHIRLLKDRVEEFYIGHKRFVQIKNTKGLRDGFYEEIYSAGQSKVLVKYRKTYTPLKSYDHTFVNMIEESQPAYYLFFGNTYHYIKNARALLRVVGSKIPLRKFIIEKALPVDEFYSALPECAAFLNSILVK